MTSAKGFAANDPRYTQTYTFDANGYLDTATNELGLTTDYDIDTAGRLTALNQSIQYSQDLNGRLIAIIGDNQNTLTFGYDSRDRRIASAFQGWVSEDDDDDDWDDEDDHNEDWDDDDREDDDDDNKKGKNNTKLPTGHNAKISNYVLTSLLDGHQELAQYATSAIGQADYQAYRQLTYLPKQVAGLYGQLLAQILSCPLKGLPDINLN